MHLHIISRADAKRAGLKYYFTGKPCKHGHVHIRETGTSKCVACFFDATLIEKKRLHDRQYYANNKSIIIDRQRKYHKSNRDRLIKAMRERRKRNIDSALAKSRSYYAKNKQKILEKYKEYALRNPEIVRQAKRNRKARSKNAQGHHTKDDIQRILKDQKHKCANCLCDVSGGYHVDHIMPLKLGGTNWPDNLQILCPTCNLRKNAKHPIDWAQENGRLL